MCCLHSKFVTAFVLTVACMSPHPLKCHFMLSAEIEQLLLQVSVDRLFFPVPFSAVGSPALRPAFHDAIG